MSIFMAYDGINGESTDANHDGWIDIDDLYWGVQRNITSRTATTNDRESANAEITDLNITRRMDAATPSLFIEACCGKGKRVVINLCKTGSGSGADVYMSYTLHRALIRHYQTKAHSQNNIRPTELLTISFQEIEVRYTPYDDNGEALPSIGVGFDTTTNQKR